MSWIATDALTSTRDATRSLLLPVDRGRWLRLALLALFVGGGIGAPTGGANFGGGGTPGAGGDVPTDFPMPDPGTVNALFGLALALIALAVLLGIVWTFVGAVMEFVLVTGLVDRNVRIREPFRAHLGRGIRLFVFRIGLLLVGLAILGIPVLAVVLGGAAVSPAILVLFVPLLLLFGLVALAGWLISLLTVDFVVPTMLATDRGILSAWSRVLTTLRREWQEVGVYLVVRVVLGIAAGIGVGLIVGILALVVAIPFLLVGAAVFVATAAGPAGPGLVGWALLGLLALLFGLSVLVVSALVQAPVVTFFRYYSLFVLGRLDADLDLVGHLWVPGDDEDGAGDGTGAGDDPDAGDGNGVAPDAGDETAGEENDPDADDDVRR